MNCSLSTAHSWLAATGTIISSAARLRHFVLIAALFACANLTAAPTISSFTPTFGASTDPSYITINGSGFSPGTLVVKFNGVTASAAASTPTLILASVPAGALPGTGPIFVSVDGNGTYSSPPDFTIIGSGPYISSFSPVSGGTGADVTIFGAHFSSPVTVKFNEITVVTDTADASQFIVKAPAGVSTGPITVTNSLGYYTTTSNFFVPPVITGFSPTNGRAGTSIVIVGTNFLGTTAVQFNGLSAANFNVLSNGAIQATAPAGVTTGPLRVIAPAASAYTYNLAASNFVVQPTITGFSPAFGRAGTNVVITGANFNVGTPVVKFNGVQATVPTSVTFGQLTAIVPASATTGPITVTTTDGTATSLTNFYLPPRITSFSPTNSAPGTTVTVNGTNFTDTSSVLFNGVTASFFNVNSNSLQATVPGSFTTGPLNVTTPGGTTNSTGLFYAAPIITGFSPTHGLPGTNVTITGTSFTNASAVKFNGVTATIVSKNAGQIVATVPTNATIGPISVTAPAGTATTATSFYLDYAPLLGINAATPPLVLLSWPGTYYTYTLQANTDLTRTSAWASVSTAPVFSGGSNVVTETNLEPTKFYRLMR